MGKSECAQYVTSNIVLHFLGMTTVLWVIQKSIFLADTKKIKGTKISPS